MMGKKDEAVEEAKKPLHPNQQKIDVHEPEKDELTAKDFEMLRAGKKAKMKEEVEEIEEEELDEAGMPSSVIKHKQKLANMSDQEFAKAHGDKSEEDLKQMAWRHGYGKMSSHYVNRVNKGKSQMEEVEQVDELSKETMSSYLQKRGSMVSPRSKNNKGNENMARAVNKIAKKTNEEVDVPDDADETILVHTPIEFELAENYMFGDYLTAAKSIVGEEAAVELANYAFNNNDTDIFVEQFLRSDIEAKVKAHEKMGHKVSMPKYSTKSGKPYAEYVVTDKEGVRRKYIHHGANRKTENMGPVGKRDDE